MKTDELEYAEYLRAKFLPGRKQYLERLIYPRYMRELPSARGVWDFGFGNGEFLSFCRKNGITTRGIDSNPHFVATARNRGLEVEQDDITQLRTVPDGGIHAALSDNVLEHLDRDGLCRFFATLAERLATSGVFLAVVPGERGFAGDPTHRTFIDESIMLGMTNTSSLILERSFRFPFNTRFVSRFFYLNMTVFVIRKGRSITRREVVINQQHSKA